MSEPLRVTIDPVTAFEEAQAEAGFWKNRALWHGSERRKAEARIAEIEVQLPGAAEKPAAKQKKDA